MKSLYIKDEVFYDSLMTIEERLDRGEKNLDRLAAVQDQMMDVLGLTMEGERRLATRTERLEETMQDVGDKLNALIFVVDGIIRRDRS